MTGSFVRTDESSPATCSGRLVSPDRKGAHACEKTAVPTTDPEDFYRAYIACVNVQDWSRLPDFVDTAVHHNGRQLGVEGYRAMLQDDFADIPDLRLVIERLIASPSCIGSRLRFD